MGAQVFGIVLAAFLAMTLFQMAGIGADVNQNGDILNALQLAAEAGVTEWDEEGTAEAGLIILDSDKAREKVYQNFTDNIQGTNLDPSNLQIEIVNNAPVTKAVDGEALHFAGNGIIVSYEGFVQVAEVDDR